MLSVQRSCQWALCCLLLWVPVAAAQVPDASPQSGPPPAHLSLVAGRAFVERDGRSEAAAENLPVLDGDRLRTEQGRAEVVLGDGSLLHVDESSTVDVLAADLFRLLQGRVYVIVRGAADPGLAARYQVDTRIASVQTAGPGEFRVSVQDGSAEVELAVYRGQATLANDLGTQDVQAGEAAIVRDGFAPSVPQYFNSARWDAFDQWSEQRRQALLGSTSAQYLPPDLGVYAGAFDQYGRWGYDQNAGNVWYPSVGTDWRPYSVGYWRDYPYWDSFWISSEPWGWPTHHYGRWGFSFGMGWYWIPDRLWGPSWVYWALSPDYVSWCPLGLWEYPVFGHFGLRGSYGGRYVDPWRGWTVLPRDHFGSRRPAHRYAIDGRRLGDGPRARFAVQRYGPGGGRTGPGGYAGGRSAGPGGDRGGPRGSAGLPRGGGPTGNGLVERRAFPSGQPSGAIGRRTESPRSTPDVMVFSNRRNGAVERVTPGAGGSPGAFGSSYPRFNGGSSGSSSPRSAVPRGYSSPSPGSSYPRFNGGSSGSSSPRSAVPRGYSSPSPGSSYPRFNGGSSGSSSPRSAVPRGYGSPSGGSSSRGSSGSFSRPQGGGSRAPSGGSFNRGDVGGSSSRSSAPRYNSGSGGSRPSSGGRSSSRSRGPGRSPD